MELLLYLGSILTVLISLALFWAYQVNQHWAKRGIPFAKPLLFIGNSLDFVLNRKTSGQTLLEISKKFPGAPLFGFFQFTMPMLIVQDHDLIERVLVKDFHHFTDRGFYVDDEVAPFDANLLNMAGKKWRAMRNKLSPMFTSGKLKAMSRQMTDTGEQMIRKLDSYSELNNVELKDIFQRLAMDVIGTCGFGINPATLENDKSEFKEIASKVFQLNGIVFAKLLVLLNFPKLAKAFGISPTNPKAISYFTEIVKETMANRRESDVQRSDFVQQMLTLKEKGFIEINGRDHTDDEHLKLDSEDSQEKEILELTTDKIVGQSLIFLTAGFDTTTAAILYLCYDLSNHQDIQSKLREEVKETVRTHGGIITFETVKSMHYLEMCLKESMRLHTLLEALGRVCTKEYTFPGTNVTVKPGDHVLIPTLCVHTNPDSYPQPHEYVPDRFDPGNDSRPNCSFLAFGDGPRICIAMRFAMTEIKIAMAHLLLRYRFELSPRTKPLSINTRSIFAEPKDKIFFNLERLQN